LNASLIEPSSLLITLAQAAPAPTTSPAAPGWLQFLAAWGPIILIFLFFWIFIGGAKRKQERERKVLLDNLKKGDSVKMVGGEYGTVVDVRGTKVLVKVDESSNTKILYAREAVSAVEKDETK
jgi:preprotein translocase subunit YajC